MVSSDLGGFMGGLRKVFCSCTKVFQYLRAGFIGATGSRLWRDK